MLKDSYILPLIGAIGIFPGCKIFPRQSYKNEAFFTMRDIETVGTVFDVVTRHEGWNLALVERAPDGMIFAIHNLDKRGKETVDELAWALVRRGVEYVAEQEVLRAVPTSTYVQ